MEEIPTVSEALGISDHLGGFLLRRGCPGEKAWLSPRSTPTEGSLTRFVPQPQTPPGLTTSPQASLPACPAVGLSALNILSEGCGGIEPPRRRVVLHHEERGLPRSVVTGLSGKWRFDNRGCPGHHPVSRCAAVLPHDFSLPIPLAGYCYSALFISAER